MFGDFFLVSPKPLPQSWGYEKILIYCSGSCVAPDVTSPRSILTWIVSSESSSTIGLAALTLHNVRGMHFIMLHVFRVDIEGTDHDSNAFHQLNRIHISSLLLRHQWQFGFDNLSFFSSLIRMTYDECDSFNMRFICFFNSSKAVGFEIKYSWVKSGNSSWNAL